MSSQATSPSQGLFDALARSWCLPAAARSFACAADDTIVAIACADGALSLAPLADPEPPDARIRISADTGRATIQPRRASPPPLITTGPLSHSALSLIAHPDGGFVVGTDSGALFRIASDGTQHPFSEILDAPVIALAALPAQALIAVACAHAVFLLSLEGALRERIDGLPEAITCLAAAPDGGHLAIAAGSHVLALTPGAAQPRMILPGGPVHSMRWRADGAYLACALGADGLALINLARGDASRFAAFPTPVSDVDWSSPAKAVLASGAFRIAGWGWAGQETPFRDSRTAALQTGQISLVPIDRVAAHPTKPLAAAGLVNGQVVIAPIGVAEELAVKPIGGSLSLLGWSPAGQLILADVDRSFTIIRFPQRLFK
ncbi:WD40 repeat domain-containing protein [Acidisoma sp. C75]